MQAKHWWQSTSAAYLAREWWLHRNSNDWRPMVYLNSNDWRPMVYLACAQARLAVSETPVDGKAAELISLRENSLDKYEIGRESKLQREVHQLVGKAGKGKDERLYYALYMAWRCTFPAVQIALHMSRGFVDSRDVYLLRDILPPPGHLRYTPLKYLHPAAAMLARACYHERNADSSLDPLALCALADALEEAGHPEHLALKMLRGLDGNGEPARTPRYRGFYPLQDILDLLPPPA